jgi:hypothetical protein
MNEARLLSTFQDPAFYANPYPLYAELRRKDPVLFVKMRRGSRERWPSRCSFRECRTCDGPLNLSNT